MSPRAAQAPPMPPRAAPKGEEEDEEEDDKDGEAASDAEEGESSAPLGEGEKRFPPSSTAAMRLRLRVEGGDCCSYSSIFSSSAWSVTSSDGRALAAESTT